MTLGGPDWSGIWADTRKGMGRFWPLLLLLAFVDTGTTLVGGLLLGHEQALETGLRGYLGYLKLAAWDVLPYSLTGAIATGLVLNGLSETPIASGAMLRRAARALPTVVLGWMIGLAVYLAVNLVTYANVDFAGWWIAYAAGGIAAAAVSTVLGFAPLEAMARGLDPAEAFRASAALTFHHRRWLAVLFLILGLIYSLIHLGGSPVDEAVRAMGVRLPGGEPLTDLAFGLLTIVTYPLIVAVYLELRRLQAEAIPGLGAIFD